MPQLAELCVIDLIRPDGSIGDTTAAAVDPTIARTLEELRARQPLRPDSEHPVAEAVRRGLPVVERDLTPEDVRARVAQSGEHGDLIVAAVYNSAAVLPMYARGRLIGALTFLHLRSDRRYDSSDVSLLSQLASRAGLAIDNARLYRERDRIARTLQAGLRPERPAEVPGADIAVIFEPAGEGIEVGGDFYDIFASPRGWFILIGDVVGKGSEAAILSAQVRHTARALARVGWPGDRIMATINDVLREAPGKNSLATAQLLELGDGDGSVARLVGAGHPPAVLVGENGTRLVGGGTMLGVIADARPAVELVELGPDDTLILYTDGWLEAGALASHREPNELAGLVERERGQRLTVLLEQLRRDAFTRAGGDLRDDLVIVGLRRAPVADRRAALAGAAASASSRS